MLNKVVDYQILSSTRTTALATMVKEALEDGWTPSGPVFEYKDEASQTMVKFGE